MKVKEVKFFCPVKIALMIALGGALLATPGFADKLRGAAPAKEMIELARAGNAANYNLDYAKARAFFEEIRKRWPGHPAGDLYLANVVWLEHLFRIRRLQTGLYQDESFYAGFEGSRESGEKGDLVDSQVDRQFRELMASAKSKALELVNADGKDPYARYYLGAIYSVSGAYEASTARRFWSALRNGSRGIDAHQQVLKLKPDYWDAYLSIGVFEYLVGNLPLAVKAFIAIGGVRGSRDRGISDLRQIIEHNSENADDARVMLIGIYQHENQAQLALSLLEQLSGKYPGNYLFKLERASTLAQLRKDKESAAAFDELIASAKSGSPALRSLDLIRYQYGEALARAGAFQLAVDQYRAAAAEPTADPSLNTRAQLRASQMLDLAGKRDEAKQGYQAVLARPNVYDTHVQAKRGLAAPYSLAN